MPSTSSQWLPISYRAKKNRRILEQGRFRAQICHNNPFLTSSTGSPNKCDTKPSRGCVTRPRACRTHNRLFLLCVYKVLWKPSCLPWEGLGRGGGRWDATGCPHPAASLSNRRAILRGPSAPGMRGRGEEGGAGLRSSPPGAPSTWPETS